MQLINSTRMVTGYSMGMEPSGREFLIVVIKGTFRIPKESGASLRLHDEQVPLVTSDVFFGAAGLSAPRYEADFALRKRRCDVVLNASAYAPGGTARSRVEVAAKIGNWSKSFAVVGDRSWDAAGVGMSASSPIPFISMPITYDRAFGGVDTSHKDPGEHASFAANPVGRGFHSQLAKDWLHGKPLPNTEELDRPISWVEGQFQPMSFGSIGRQWSPRLSYAGTYDQEWLDKSFPFLPADFDDFYYQSVPEDQQLVMPVGEQVITLVNMTPDCHRVFTLPHLEAPVHVFTKSGEQEDLVASVDTILIEPDEERVTMTWRVARPLKKNIFEIAQVLVGKKGREWWQQRGAAAFSIPVVVLPMEFQEADEDTDELEEEEEDREEAEG